MNYLVTLATQRNTSQRNKMGNIHVYYNNIEKYSVSVCDKTTHWQIVKHPVTCPVNVYIHHCKHMLFWRIFTFTTGSYITLNVIPFLLCAVPNKLHSQIYNYMTTVCMYVQICFESGNTACGPRHLQCSAVQNFSASPTLLNIGTVWDTMKTFLLQTGKTSCSSI